MIVTLTANPSLDRTLHIARLTRGAVHRADAESVEPSGKGVNVALGLQLAQVDVTAVLPVGGPAGQQLIAMLREAGLPHVAVAIRGAVRSNVSVVEADGTTTKLNEVGPELSGEEIDRLLAATLELSGRGDWVAFCGSLPNGFGTKRLADALAQARQQERMVALDTSGAALGAVLSQPVGRLPHLIKPNAQELAELTGRSLLTIGDVTQAAQGLHDHGVARVLVSLGGDGAVLLEDGLALHGVAPVARVVNSVGAGDAFLAGYLAACVDPDSTAEQRLSTALRFGAAAVQHDGTLFDTTDLDLAVEISSAHDREIRARALSA